MISRCRVVTLDEQRKNPGCLGHYRGLYYPVIQQPVRVCISWLRAALLRGSELPELPADRIGLDWKNARKSQGDDVFGIVGIFSHGFCFGPKFRRMVGFLPSSWRFLGFDVGSKFEKNHLAREYISSCWWWFSPLWLRFMIVSGKNADASNAGVLFCFFLKGFCVSRKSSVDQKIWACTC